MGYYNFSGSIKARDIKISGNYAYIADEENGIVIIDVSDPSSPAILRDMFWLNLNKLSGM
jgi:hypothetical protein